ncbi:mitochondrial 37S ribosomal protein bS18m NDAI_0E04510 [Naumovozyma dairenensis CBS 421]|uniref:Small ribosomal subunit protein bS18m n=1 Tax=Naumovozyma dairenensis (strain ATCC 10597 / BCRC 20456 / CBS 421 / NBRC 0211 / NRRL Y-12639) TaxID=1071378 RepID=G0WBZ8_NAUDC|nr:hypothetical protein NDAI_0E04510 [Naumovozyma dairenensis CBS 421]CCD25268.1 hypothetical protein NDAI_0E04510 [Naumovozyma dairenensis CBS 421]
MSHFTARLKTLASGILSRRFISSSKTLTNNNRNGFSIKPQQKNSLDIGSNSTKKAINNMKQIDDKFVKKFQPGSIYDPFDFSMARLYYTRKNNMNGINNNRRIINPNILDKKFNPLDLYSSPNKLYPFLTSTGKILHRDVTGLSAKNQRRVSKAIRRAQSIGLISKTCGNLNTLPTRNIQQ